MIQKNERKHYASDLSDSQWAILEPLFPPAGNKSKWEKRELVDAVLYLVENGCKWRNSPHDFPRYTTVANFYYAAIKSGLWENIRAALVEKCGLPPVEKLHQAILFGKASGIVPPSQRAFYNPTLR